MTSSELRQADLDRLRQLLVEQRRAAVRRMTALARDVDSIVDVARLSVTDDEHDPEGATIAFERSQASALLASAHRQLLDVDAALARIDDDAGYGRCASCGEMIAVDRLMARPAARHCIACAAGLTGPRR